MYRQARYSEPLIFELGKDGRRAYLPPKTDVPKCEIKIPKKMLRKIPPELPELSEGEVIRHYVHLSQMNYDGANFNAIMGKVRPGDMGFDVVHFNLHKTFSTPHGGGGPGAGAICCSDRLKPFLPVPIIEYNKKEGKYYLNYNLPKSIGKVHSFYGNIGVCLKAYAYIAALGAKGLKATAEHAVLTANYLIRKLEKIDGLKLSHNPSLPRKHEFVLEATPLKHKYDISAMDIAKLLINRGIHAPTVYFPLIVHEALMIEPTENENKELLDQFAEVMRDEIEKAKEDPEYAHKAPYKTAVGRVDDAYAIKNLILSWKMMKERGLVKKGSE